MADYFPLIVDAANSTIDELPAGDNLNLANSGIVNAGNITAANFIGDGSQLTNLPIGTTLSNGNSNVSIPQANGNIILNVAGSTVATVTNSGIEVTGNIIPVTDLTYDLGNASRRWNDLYLSGNTIYLGDSTISTDANTLVLTNGNGGSFEVGGNATVTTIQNGNSNIAVSANGNVVTSVAGTANVVVVTGTGVNVAGTLRSTGNANVGNIGAINGVFTNVSGNGSSLSSITGANVSGAVAFATTANSVDGANVSGAVAYATTANSVEGANVNGAVSSATTAGTVTTNAQPNITSTGTLSTLTVTGIVDAGQFKGDGGNISNIQGANVSGTVANATNAANATFATSAGSATTAGTVTTAAQPNITSVGTLTSLGVNGNITAANITANTGVFAGNGSGLSAVTGANVTGAVAFATTANAVAGANVSGAVAFATTANAVAGANVSGAVAYATTANSVAGANVTGQVSFAATANSVAGANVTGTVANATHASTANTVTTAAQPNITSVGTLTSLTATGNVSGGNLTTTGVLSVTGTGVSSIAGNLDMTSNTIINLASPTNPTDAATKQYVDDVAQGLNVHDSCNAATNTTLAIISGGTVTYDNGTSGVGATLTTTGTYTTIDGVTLSNGMRILVKDQSNAAQNGIYVRTSATVLTRSTDFDTSTEMEGGDFTFVNAGTLYDNTGWVMTDPVTTVGTTNVVWVQFSGAGTYTAGTGLVLNGSEFSIANTAVAASTYGNGDRVASFTVNAQGQITNAANTVITANAANLSGTTLKSTVVNSSLTSVGTLGTLSVTGNANVGNIGATNGVFTNVSGNGSSLSSITGANVTGAVAFATTSNAVAGANVSGQVSNALVAGTVYTAAQPNVTSVGTLTGLAVNGNITAANITANTGVFTGNGGGLTNLNGPNVTGQVLFAATANSVAGANVSGTVANATFATSAGTAGTVTTAAQPNITSVGTLGSLTVTNKVTAGQLQGEAGNISNVQGANVSGAVAFATTANAVAGANVSGAVAFATTANAVAGSNVSGTVNSATTAGTVTTAAQPNITSVGTLTSLGVNGNITAANITANTGVFTGNGSGLSAIAGANVTGTVANATYAVSAGSAGSATTAATVTTAAQPNITSVGTLTSLTVSGNANVGNIGANNGVFTSVSGNGSALTALNGSNITTGTIAAARVATLNQNTTGYAATVSTAAQPNITSVGTLTGLAVNGNITAANITANTGVFTGNGSGLSAIAGANVTGQVSFAATANSVAGANVTGTVSSATSATTAGTVTTAAQPNITSVGTLTSLTVSGNANAGNIGATNFVGSGASLTSLNASNLSSGTLAQARLANSNVILGSTTLALGTTTTTIAGLSSVTSTTFVGALTGAATTAGTVTTAAQPNITSVGTLSSLSVTGNVAAGNLTTTGILSVTGTGTSSIAGNLDMTGNTIANLATPTSDADAATKAYVDNLVSSGIHYHQPVRVESPIALNATYNNGTAGVGATLTNAGANVALSIDGVSLSVADRVLIYQQANAVQNGVYVVTTVGDGSTAWVLTRASDADTYAPSSDSGLDEGSYFFVQEGTTGAGESYVVSTVGTITFGTTEINFAQFSKAPIYTAGTGLTLTNEIFSVNASQTQITSVGTLTGLNSSGTVTAPAFTANTGVFTGNGSALTALNASNVSSGTLAQARLANASVTLGNTALTLGGTTTTVTGLSSVTSTTFVGALTGAATTAGTVTTAAQPNITSVGTLTSLTVTGNANVGNIGATTFVGSGASLTNLNASNLASGTVPSARLSGTYTITVSGSATTAGTVTTAAQPNITSVGTLTGLGVSGNVTATNITANTGIFSGNGSGLSAIAGSNVTGAVAFATTANAVAGANVSGTVANATFATSAGSATTAGTVTTAAQPNITSVGTLTSLAVTGNITAGNANVTGQLISTVANGTAPFVVTSTTRVNNLNADFLGGLTTDTNGSNNTIVARTGNGQVVGNTLLSSIATGTAPIVVTSTTRVANLNVAQSGVADSINVVAGTGNNFIVFANAATGNVAELTSTGLIANLSNNSITATTFVGALSGAATSATTAGTVTTAAQPNITSVGTLTSLGVSGTVTASAFTANTGVFTGNGSGLTALNGSNITTGTIAAARVATLNQNTTGSAATVTTAAQPNITSVGTLTGLTANGNVTFNHAAAQTTKIQATAAQTSDMVQIVGNTVTAGVNALYVGFTGGAANVEASAMRIDLTPGGTSGATWSGLRLTQGAVTATGVTVNVIKADSVTAGAGQDNILYVGTGYDNIINYNGTTVINGTGQVIGSQVTGTVPSATAATTAGTVTTAAQPNITSVGTLTSLTVSGNANAGNVGATNFVGSGASLTNLNASNLASGTVPSARLSGTYTITVSGSATTAGTVTTAAQPNITSVGTLSSLSVTGNVAAGNLTTTGVLSVTGTGVSSIAGNLDMTSNNIVNLATPVNPQDAATKQYVDDVAQGLQTHDSCNAATQTTLAAISGGTVTYNNGSSGVGATLTTTGSYATVDGVTLSNGMRILVKNEANAAHNGIYDRTSTTVLTRSTDFDTPTEMAGGDFTFVSAGTLYDNTGWVMTDPITTVGTTAVNWVQFSGAGTYTAGTGLTLTGSQFSVNASQTQVTSVGTLTGLNSSGTVTAPAFTANTGVFTGNGSALTALNASNISTGTIAAARVATLNQNTTGYAATVSTAAQPNITSVGTLTSLNSSGTITAPAFTANTGVFTGNGSALTALNASNISTGTIAAARVATLNQNTTGSAATVTTAAQPNITSVGTLTSLNSSGTITAPAFTANTGIFTGNGSALTALNASNLSSGTIPDARISGSYTGMTNLTGSGTVDFAKFLGSAADTVTAPSFSWTGDDNTGIYSPAADQLAITAGGTQRGLFNSSGLTVTGTATATTFSGSGASLTTLNASNVSSGTLAQARLANASVTLGSTTLTLGSTVTTVAGLSSVTSTTFVGSLSGAATTAGTVTTAAQPNITSTGTLTSLTVSGNANFDSGTLFVDSVNNEVGIGTTTPLANIDIRGNARIQSNIAYVSPNGANTINEQMLNGGTLAWSGNAGQLFSITDSMTGNIFTVNDVSGIPMISVDAGGNIQFAASGGFVSYGVTTGISAAGSTQGTATTLTRPINVVSTVSASTGVILPTVPAGARILVMNTSATALNVYPPSGAAINSAATNAAYAQPAGARLEFVSVSATQWYTLNATYG